MKITVIIPCFNEADSIPELIQNLRLIENDFYFIILDNGSIDNTPEVLNKIDLPDNIVSIRKETNKGYGAGIKFGLKQVKTEYCGWMHGDLQQNPKVLLKAKDLIHLYEKDENQLVAFKGLRTGRSIIENIFTSGVAIFCSILFFDFYWDIAGQPNIFKTSELNFLDNAPDDHTFDFYIYIYFLRKKGHFKRFKAPFSKRKYGRSSWDRGLISKLKHSNLVFKYLIYLKFKIRNSAIYLDL